MFIGTKILLVGLIILGFGFILGQLVDNDIPDNAKLFIGGIIFTGLVVVAVGGIITVLML